MALKRVLEPELIETESDAREYGKIDHAAAEAGFVGVLSEELGFVRGKLVDFGAGPCGIPVEICRRLKGARVTAVELAPAMLELAAGRIALSGCSRRIRLVRADAKGTGLPAGSFDFAVCNNLVHHIADPRLLFSEIARLLRPGGGVLIRDLRRPRTSRELADRMGHCCGDTPRQRELLRSSLLAALLPEEAAAFARRAGLKGLSLRVEGDRHWELRRALV